MVLTTNGYPSISEYGKPDIRFCSKMQICSYVKEAMAPVYWKAWDARRIKLKYVVWGLILRKYLYIKGKTYRRTKNGTNTSFQEKKDKCIL
jgi:hypothetical protein